MESIIKKAIEGGWRKDNILNGIDIPSGFSLRYDCVLDPLFWQSLGKACGWEKKITEWSDGLTPYEGNGKIFYKDIFGWQYYAMKFHEINLTESWDKAVEYLSELIK